MVTGDMGELLPIQCVPVLPGDTMQGGNSVMIRVSPLNTPVMHPVNVRVHTFFCPVRIIDGEFENFITGGPDGNNSYTVPKTSGTITKGSLLEYLGVPPTTTPVSVWPLRAANQIFNDYYRDQDLVTARALADLTIPKIAWEKDYFTTARPWSQKGPAVTVPIGQKADIATDGTVGQTVGVKSTAQSNANVILGTGGASAQIGSGSANSPLYADLAAATGVNVNDFRASFAIQRYQEARSRYGSRFTEYLRYLGITPSDARLQRPEYLGGGSARLNFSEVLQTAEKAATPDTGVGDLYGHGIAGLRTPRWRRFFEEHGYVISFLSVRPKALYVNGIPRDYLKSTKEDFFQRELANLGQQEVYNAEIFGDDGLSTFGYQDRYDEYRSHPSGVGQDFRDVLNAWHLGRELQTGVALNQTFVECKPSKRIHQVQTNNVLWIMANNHLVARRMVPKVARPRIL